MFLSVFSADIYFLWAVDVLNKKKNRKKMEKWDHFETFKYHIVRKVLEMNLKHGRLLFPCILLENFTARSLL